MCFFLLLFLVGKTLIIFYDCSFWRGRCVSMKYILDVLGQSYFNDLESWNLQDTSFFIHTRSSTKKLETWSNLIAPVGVDRDSYHGTTESSLFRGHWTFISPIQINIAPANRPSSFSSSNHQFSERFVPNSATLPARHPNSSPWLHPSCPAQCFHRSQPCEKHNKMTWNHALIHGVSMLRSGISGEISFTIPSLTCTSTLLNPSILSFSYITIVVSKNLLPPSFNIFIHFTYS